MATTISLTDGTTTVQLNSGSITVLEYNQTQQDESGSNGQSTGAFTESMNLLLIGASASAVRASVRSVENMLETARRRSGKMTGPRVFLQTQFEGDTQLWRSELYNGKLISERIADEFWRGKVEAQLTFTRSSVWEGPETELAISSSGYAAATGGRIITNNSTANWVEIASAQIDGSAPALVRLRLQNNTGVTRRFDYVYVGNNAFAGPSTFEGYVAGESAITGVIQAQGDTVGGQVCYATVNTTPGVKFTWRFTANQMQAAARYFRIIARMWNSNNVFVRLSIMDYGAVTTIWRGGTILITDQGGLVDLGAVPIPPGAYDTSYARVQLALEAWMASGSGTISVDYLSVLGTDSFATYRGLGWNVLASDYIEFDEIERRYVAIEAGAKHPLFVSISNPLIIYPGITQRLWINHGYIGAVNVLSEIADQLKVQIWYRPTRITV